MFGFNLIIIGLVSNLSNQVKPKNEEVNQQIDVEVPSHNNVS